MRSVLHWVGWVVAAGAAVAACSSTSTQPSGSGGSAGTTTGGSAGVSSGGSAGTTTGGSGGATGGSAGATTGGSAGAGGQAGGGTGDASASKRVFVTSQRYYGNLVAAAGKNLGGLASGDALCAELAKTAGLGEGPWVAWLSVASVSASDRISGDGPWARVDGVPVFANHAALTGTPANPISVTEAGTSPTSGLEVWTGTDLGGTPAGVQHCASWNGGTATVGQFGLLDQKDAKWTNGGVPDACDQKQHRLYCFEM